MKNILKDLWKGTLAPNETFCHHQEYREKQRALLETEKALLAHLDEKGRALFAQFDNCLSELEEVENALVFSSGFSIAVHLLFESFEGH